VKWPMKWLPFSIRDCRNNRPEPQYTDYDAISPHLHTEGSSKSRLPPGMRTALALLAGLWCTLAPAAELNVAVAANFAATLRVLAAQFQRATDHSINISIASSGKLSTQIMHGAPYDVFLSADGEHPLRLIDANLAHADSLFTYALGTLVLWQPDNSGSQGQTQQASATNADNLASARLIALASPRHAPYGRAAKETLIALGHWQTLIDNGRLAFAESVGQAWHFGASGNADLAFVALSQVKAAAPEYQGTISYWPVPPQLHTPIVQRGIILLRSGEPELARRFCHWLQTDPWVRATIIEAGYHLPTLGKPEEQRDD